MAEYKIDAPDKLYDIPKTYDPMDEPQLAQLFRNLLDDHALKKLKMSSAAARKKFCDDKLAEKPIKDLIQSLAKATGAAREKAVNLEKALLGKMGMEIKNIANDIKKKYGASGDKIIKPQLEKEWAESQKKIEKAMKEAVKKIK